MRRKVRGNLKIYNNAALLWQAVSKTKDDGGSVCYQNNPKPESMPTYFTSRKDFDSLTFPVLVDKDQDWDSSVVHSFVILRDSEINSILRDLKDQVSFLESFKNKKK